MYVWLALVCSWMRRSGSEFARGDQSGSRSTLDHPVFLPRLRSVQLTVVDREGHRHVLRGLEGQTVADVLENNVELFGDDGEPVEGVGRERGEMPGLPNVIASVCIYSLQSW